MAEVVLQSLTLVSTELAPPRTRGALVTQREDIVAEGRDGELGALIRQVSGRADHCEGGLVRKHRRTVKLFHVFV